VRPDRLLAGISLTVILALVAVPDIVGHETVVPTVSPEAFAPVLVDRARVAATSRLDPANRSGSALAATTALTEPAEASVDRARPGAPGFAALGGSIAVPRPSPKRPPVSATSGSSGSGGSTSGGSGGWRTSGSSWYGSGFYGSGTACGQTYTKTIIGVAHKTLPCGTVVEFRNPTNGRVVRAAVIDRGPYVAGRDWDLSRGLCVALDHCFTAPIQWRLP
jgi:hypothetical protein